MLINRSTLGGGGGFYKSCLSESIKCLCRDAVTDVFLDALAEAALLQLHHFSARQLATLAYNYGTLNHWGRNDQELLDAITIRMLHQHSVSSLDFFD